MDGRRLRIKPTVNLRPKRKSDSQKIEITKKTCVLPTSSSEYSNKKYIQQNSEENKSHASNILKIEDSVNKLTENTIPSNQTSNECYSSPFKRPSNVRAPENLEIQTVSTDNQQNSFSTQLKYRQRIKPIPCLSSRRCSTQGNSINETEEESQNRRQRHLSEQGQGTIYGDKLQFGDSCDSERFKINDSLTEGSVILSNVSRNQISSYRKMASSEQNQTQSVVRKVSTKYGLKPLEKSTMKMLDFIYYNPPTNPMNKETTAEQSSPVLLDLKVSLKSEGKTTNNSTQSNDVQENVSIVPVPQLKLSPSGEVILDEKSLIIETTAEKEGRKNLLKSEILYLDDCTGSNGFYKRQKRTKEWPSEETIKFYRCLHTVGTDFSLMLTFFPNRTRRDLKLKFKKEERTNLGLINKTLRHPNPFNVEELKIELEKEEKETAEKYRRLKELQLLKTKKKYSKKDYSLQSKDGRILKCGDEAYSYEFLSAENVKRTKSENCPIKGEESDKDDNDNKSDMNADDEQIYFDSLINVGDIEKEENVEDVSDNSNKNTKRDKMNEDGFSLGVNLLEDINKVLKKLINGSLVLVTSEDKINPGKLINEIYLMNKKTEQLSDKPLDLSEDVINYLISEAFK